MIRTIIFDLGKVLIPFDYNRGYERLAPLAGCQPSEIPGKLRNYDLVERLESGKIEPEAFVRELSSILKINCSYDDFCAIWSSIFGPVTIIPESMIEALGRRYRLVLLSNTNAIHFDMLWHEYPILRHFDELVLSYKVGAMKPLPLIYEAAIQAGQCLPSECFFTDDIEVNITAAKDAGMDAVQFHDLEQLTAELKARGVEW